MGTAEQLLLFAYFAVLGVLAIYGIHRLFLVWLYLSHRRSAPSPSAKMCTWPLVTVQLPIFNELYVVDRLLEAVASLDYPRERLEIQVLDDSTDETRVAVARRVALLRSRGVDIVHLHRSKRVGFKAGALAAGLAVARGEFVCIFDADFVPPADFLRRTLPYFVDPLTGMVQVRWEHLNREFSLLTRVQAMLLDAHFVIEQASRNWSGRFFNFNGTAGVWRRAAIDDAGGWQHDTLTEDLDLSYRAQLRGWRFVYVNDPAPPAELPVSIDGFKSQQHRWTKGAVQTARKLLATVWRSRLPLPIALEATFHLTANVTYPLMVALSLLVFPAIMVRWANGWGGLVELPILLFATGSVGVFYLAAQHAVGRSWGKALARLPALMALGIGISLNNTVAVLQGLGREPGEFVRTPKFSVVRRGQRWRHKRYGSRRAFLTALELAVGLYFTGAVATAAYLGIWVSVPFLMLFQAGYLYTALLGYGHERAAPVAPLPVPTRN